MSKKITDPEKVDDALREEIFSLNTLDLVCDKHELDWPIKGWKLKVPKLMKLLLSASGNGTKQPEPDAKDHAESAGARKG